MAEIHISKIALREDQYSILIPEDRVFGALVDKALQEANILRSEASEIKLTIEQVTEGSPPYNVQKWKARVNFVVKVSDV